MRITTGRIIAVAAVITAGGFATTAMASQARDGGGAVAKVTMRNAAGEKVGTVRFGRDGNGTAVRVELRLDPAAAGTYHGFHVHANSDPANGDGCIADAAAPNTAWFQSADGHSGSSTGRTTAPILVTWRAST